MSLVEQFHLFHRSRTLPAWIMLQTTSCRNKFSSLLATLAFCAATLHWPASSRAQDWIGPTPMDYANMTTNFTNTLIMNAVIENMVNKRAGVDSTTGGTGASAASSRNTTTASTTNSSAFTYTATPAQRAAYLDAYIANLAKSKPTLAASLRTQLGKHDYNTIYNGLLSGTGLTSDNLADAFTAYTVLGWMVVNEQTSDPLPAHIAGVRRQWASALGRTGFAQNADSRRQTAEELKIRMVLLHAGWKDAQKLGQSAAYANTVDGLFQSQMKLRLRGMTLSAAGLRSRG